MESENVFINPSKSILWQSPTSKLEHVLFIQRSTGLEHMPPGIYKYVTYDIGNFCWTISLCDRAEYSEVVGLLASNMPEAQERFLASDSYMKLVHNVNDWVVLINRRDDFLISDILASFDNKEDAEAYFNSLTHDIELGDISIVTDDGTNIFKWEGPPLLPVLMSGSLTGLANG